MPLTEAKIKCLECEDVFTADSKDFTKCKCGKTEVRPDKYSTSYRDHGVNFKTLESNTYYFEDDFLKLDKHLLSIYENIKTLAKELGFYINEMKERGKDGQEFLDVISISKDEFVSNYSSSMNKISFYCRLGKTYSTPKYETVEKRLTRFLSFLEDLKNDNIKIKNRTKLLQYAEERNMNWSKEQVEEYDYNFSF